MFDFLARYFKKLRKKEDFTPFVKAFKKMAPLTYDHLGEKKISEIFKGYFKEILINDDDLEENIFYIPLYLKKHLNKLTIPQHLIELCDYEFSCFQIIQDPTHFEHTIYNDLNTEVFANPVSQALRLEHDILNYQKNLKTGIWNKDKKPDAIKNMLLISKNPENQELVFVRAEKTHAAILDELHDGKMVKKDLIQSLQDKFPEIPQRDWIVALKDLKSNYLLIEKEITH